MHGWFFAFVCAADIVRLPRALNFPRLKNSTSDLFPQAMLSEFGTADTVVFDELSWKPTCKDLLAYAAGNPGLRISVGIQKVGLADCLKHTRNGTVELDADAVNLERTAQKPIHFLHVSKSGGTFFCGCGNENGLNPGLLHDMATNCNFLWEDKAYWESNLWVPLPFAFLPSKTSCNVTAGHMRSRNIGLEGNENFLPGDGELCPEFENILIMRDPMHRLISHLHQMLYDPTQMTPGEIQTKFPRLSNNYFARVLGGEAVHGLPYGQLPPELLEKTRRKLHEFDDVFLMDEHLEARVEGRYGWNCSGVLGRRNPGGTKELVAAVQQSWPPGDWEELLAANAVDAELFKEAQIMNAAQSLFKQAGVSEDYVRAPRQGGRV